jgi:hypothetical protein
MDYGALRVFAFDPRYRYFNSRCRFGPQKEFSAPVTKSYLLTLRFVFPSTEVRLEDELVGDGHTSSFCTSNVEFDAIPQRERRGLGPPIPFKVVVRTYPAGTPVVEQTFHSLCKMGYDFRDGKYRNVGRFDRRTSIE